MNNTAVNDAGLIKRARYYEEFAGSPFPANELDEVTEYLNRVSGIEDALGSADVLRVSDIRWANEHAHLWAEALSDLVYNRVGLDKSDAMAWLTYLEHLSLKGAVDALNSRAVELLADEPGVSLDWVDENIGAYCCDAPRREFAPRDAPAT